MPHTKTARRSGRRSTLDRRLVEDAARSRGLEPQLATGVPAVRCGRLGGPTRRSTGPAVTVLLRPHAELVPPCQGDVPVTSAVGAHGEAVTLWSSPEGR